jgi:hypothetical protein
MKNHVTEIEVTFEESPVIEIEPVTRIVKTGWEKCRNAWAWFRG